MRNLEEQQHLLSTMRKSGRKALKPAYGTQFSRVGRNTCIKHSLYVCTYRQQMSGAKKRCSKLSSFFHSFPKNGGMPVWQRRKSNRLTYLKTYVPSTASSQSYSSNSVYPYRKCSVDSVAASLFADVINHDLWTERKLVKPKEWNAHHHTYVNTITHCRRESVERSMVKCLLRHEEWRYLLWKKMWRHSKAMMRKALLVWAIVSMASKTGAMIKNAKNVPDKIEGKILNVDKPGK